MPNNTIILPKYGDGTPEDPMFGQVMMLFRADKGLIDLSLAPSTFDIKTAPLTTTYSKFGGPTLEFDGTNAKRLESSTGKGMSLKDTGWTLEAWFYIDATAADRGLISNQAGADGGSALMYITSARKLAIFNNLARATSVAAFSANGWHHAAVVKDGNASSTLFLDGQPETYTGNWAGDYSSITGFAIGGRIGGSVMHKGAIDSVRVTQGIRYTGAFTPEQFPTH